MQLRTVISMLSISLAAIPFSQLLMASSVDRRKASDGFNLRLYLSKLVSVTVSATIYPRGLMLYPE